MIRDEPPSLVDAPVRYRLTGMDCSSCAAKIEGAARTVAGVQAVRVSIASQEMTLRLDKDAAPLPEVERAVTGLGYKLARLDADDDDDKISDLSHVTAAYRRALWIVVLLNVGYGAVEIFGGFIAGSQALKADALDFLGDGLISFLGLIAVGWGLAARAKAALLQGIFLGLLGLGVLTLTAYRVLVVQQPEAELMGILGLVALGVNVAAAVVLLAARHPHHARHPRLTPAVGHQRPQHLFAIDSIGLRPPRPLIDRNARRIEHVVGNARRRQQPM